MTTMSDPRHVDGSAIGGLLMEVFGREMTDARGCCASCGKVHHVAQMMVYRGPGDVARCPTCGSIVVVAVTIGERVRLHLGGLRWLEPTSS
jgi:Family of unknown function (DUF6510)